MSVPHFMRIGGETCRYKPEGEVTLVDGVALVTDAITYCNVHGIPKMLVDVRGLTGHAVPTLVDRFWMAQDWAQAAGGKVTVAVVASARDLDHSRFGIKAAQDAGLLGEVFTSADEAEAWLAGGARQPTVPEAP